MSTMPRMTCGRGQARLTEKQFSRQIKDLARALGWVRCYHTQYSLGSEPGYPDLTFSGHRRFGHCWIEVKGATGKATEEQKQYCRDIQDGGSHAYIAFPRDVEAVEALLRGELPLPEYPTPYIADHWEVLGMKVTAD